MDEYLQAFSLGNAAILGNVCVLPLYPGLIAFLGGASVNGRSARYTPLLGFVVFAGIMTVMLILGFVLYQLNRTFGSIFDWFLPLIYGSVVILGVLMILGRNPFKRMSTAQVPIVSNPLVTAFLYGMLLGPMTLPCSGPIVISTFILGVDDFGTLSDGIFYFLSFGLGFGWPLILLPFLAAPFQRSMTRWLTQHQMVITRLSGLLLVGVAVMGFWIDVIPNIT